MTLHTLDDFYAAVHDVPDFPTRGIVFRDITPLLGDHRLFSQVVAQMAEPYRNGAVTRVVGIESRGFILGAPIALELGVGLVLVRKEGKLPRERHRVEYSLEYGDAAIEMHADSVGAGDRVLIVDDVLATGGTAAAAHQAVTAAGGEVAGFSFLIELAALEGRGKLDATPVDVILTYPRP